MRGCLLGRKLRLACRSFARRRSAAAYTGHLDFLLPFSKTDKSKGLSSIPKNQALITYLYFACPPSVEFHGL